MNLKQQNWHNLCKYHIGDWYGTWTRYTPEKKVFQSFRGIRSLKVNADRTEVNHQNYYTYADGKKETKSFGPYKKPDGNALFLDNSFCWLAEKVNSKAIFFSEIGIRHGKRRASLATIYNYDLSLQKITVISEHLNSNISLPPRPLPSEICQNWQGISKEMQPDLTISAPQTITWQPLQDLNKAGTIFDLNDGFSVICPLKVELGKDFIIAIDWLFDRHVLYRGIIKYQFDRFSSFSLECYRDREN